jgi:hypothetical protein
MPNLPYQIKPQPRLDINSTLSGSNHRYQTLAASSTLSESLQKSKYKIPGMVHGGYSTPRVLNLQIRKTCSIEMSRPMNAVQ